MRGGCQSSPRCRRWGREPRSSGNVEDGKHSFLFLTFFLFGKPRTHLNRFLVHGRPSEDRHGVLHYSPSAHVQVGDRVPGPVQGQEAALVQVLVLPDGVLSPAQSMVVVSEGQRALEFIIDIIPGPADLVLGEIGVVVFTKS